MRPSRALIVILVALTAGACMRKPAYYAPSYGAQGYAYPSQTYASPSAAAYGRPGAASAAYGGPYAPVGEPPYTLDAGDRVRVTVFGQEGLNNTYSVDPSGLITLPLGGAISARGLTKDQLAQAITSKLSQGFIREPHVAVEIETYRPFFILGEVNAPGQYPYMANLTVENAVAVAGGFTPRADRRKIVVTRTIGGQMFRGPLPPNSPLRPGDSLTVEERWF